jgi:hypothetical protein
MSAAIVDFPSTNPLPEVRHVTLWAFFVFCVLTFGSISLVCAADDNENDTPTAWWVHSGQTFSEIQTTISQNNARIIDIKVDSTLSHYTVTYVKNVGSYAKSWWWYVGINASELANVLSTTGARLISLQPYDGGGGNLLFNVSMIANSGADAKSWWYYYNMSAAGITSTASAANARLTTLKSYTLNGQTYYAFIMISNTGADAKAWWWHAGATPQQISTYVSNTDSRILDLTPTGNGTFNVVQEACPSGGCPAWWWYTGASVNQLLTYARDDGARVFAADTGPNCSSNCLAAVLIGNTPADITACDPQGCISEAQLSTNICSQLENQVVGYVCLVGGMRPVFGGLAHTNADPPETPMTPDLTTNVASVSKTMTATAILQLLTANGLTPDALIAPYLYSDWQQGGNIGLLTFKDLLRHASGFKQKYGTQCDSAFDYASVETLVAGGVNSTDIGNPDYGNCNFSLLRELMPALLGQKLTNYSNGSARAAESSSLYIAYLQNNVFDPVGAGGVSCTPSGSTGILSYPYPAGTSNGVNWGDQSLACGASGWQLSAFNIFDVVNSLASNVTLLSQSDKDDMIQNCLGWDCAVNRYCPTPYVCKNGMLPDGSVQVWTYAGILKCNVPVVIVVNSPLPPAWEPGGTPGTDTIGIVANAYQNSIVPGAGPPCPQ